MSRQLEFIGVIQAVESSMWGSSMYMLFRGVRVEENSKGVRVEGEDKRSELGTFAHSDIQRMGMRTQQRLRRCGQWCGRITTVVLCKVGGYFKSKGVTAFIKYCYYIEYGGLRDCDLEKHLGRAERMEKQELETSVDNSF